jgi:hypothetical protein
MVSSAPDFPGSCVHIDHGNDMIDEKNLWRSSDE